MLRENDPVLETLPLVLSGKAAVDSELDANKSAVSMRSLPLMDANGRVGAVVLCRDVTELRRREKELQTKDATISEIHHRVKNNLQAVSALLRLQARKTKSEEVKKELKEAQRRVQTIAMVHEGLNQTADEIVDYDKVISSLLKMAVDLATMRDQHIDIDFIGRFGMMPAQDATPLSLVLTELITNSVEHGFEGRKKVISRFPWDAVATTSMLWSKTMARAWPMRSMMVWHVPPDPVWERRSSARSSTTISEARSVGSPVVAVAPE